MAAFLRIPLTPRSPKYQTSNAVIVLPVFVQRNSSPSHSQHANRAFVIIVSYRVQALCRNQGLPATFKARHDLIWTWKWNTMMGWVSPFCLIRPFVTPALVVWKWISTWRDVTEPPANQVALFISAHRCHCCCDTAKVPTVIPRRKFLSPCSRMVCYVLLFRKIASRFLPPRSTLFLAFETQP